MISAQYGTEFTNAHCEKIDSEILRLLEVLLSSKRTVEEKKQILEKEYDIKMTETIESEVSKMCNLSDGVERQGIEKGLQQGLQTARYEAVKNIMKNLNLTCEQAIKALGISVKEWGDIKDLYEDDTLYENVKKNC